MSSQLNVIAFISDVDCLKAFFFSENYQEETRKDVPTPKSDWDDVDWNWNSDDDYDEKENNESVHNNTEKEKDFNFLKNDFESSMHSSLSQSSSSNFDSIGWLKKSLVSLSPVGDIMVVAYNEKIVYLTQKWDSKDNGIKVKYHISYKGVPVKEGETITCVCCLPLASHKKSSNNGVDWTCIIVGFSSGYVRIYTITGTLLLDQLFGEGPVLQVKCSTYMMPRYDGEKERLEEIMILYNQMMAVIDGFSFLQSMKACKNYAARVSARGMMVEPTDLPVLAHKKHRLVDQHAVVDAVPCGQVTIPVFDQLVRDSLALMENSVRNTLTLSNVCLVAGSQPYVNFFHTVRNITTPMLSEVAGSLINAFMSTASGWLRGGGAETKVAPKTEPETLVYARHGLYDKRRIATSVCLSPDLKMAAVTDNLARVVLIEVSKGIAIRTWKGYRDAQVGWIEAKETELVDSKGNNNIFNKSSGNRERCKVVFLVLYAPKRGILEVWSAPCGPRVATFNTAKTSLLIQPAYGILGFNNASMTPDRKSFFEAINMYSRVMMLGEDGYIKEVCVPFHAVFSSMGDRRTRDNHMLKKLIVVLKDNKDDKAILSEIHNIFRNVHTPFIKTKCFDKVLSTPYIKSQTIRSVCDTLIKKGGSKALVQRCHFVNRLLDIYDAVSILIAEKSASRKDEVETNQLKDTFSLDEEESNEVLSSFSCRFSSAAENSLTQKKVTFEEKSFKVVTFLECFEMKTCGTQDSTEAKDKEADENVSDFYAVLTANTEQSKKAELGDFLFKKIQQGNKSVERSMRIEKYAFISRESLLDLLVCHTLNTTVTSYRHLFNIHSMFTALCSLKSLFESDWLTEKLVNECIQSLNVFSAFCLILCGRSVVFERLKKKNVEKLDSIDQNTNEANKKRTPDEDNRIDDEDDWETVNKDKQYWLTLSKLFQDLLHVENLFVAVNGRRMVEQGEEVPPTLSICMRKILDRGTGVIPELIGRFFSNYNLPLSIIKPPISEPHQIHDTQHNSNNDQNLTANNTKINFEETISQDKPTKEASKPFSSTNPFRPQPPSSLQLTSTTPSEEIDKFFISPSSSSLSLLVRSASSFQLDTSVLKILQSQIRTIQEHFPSSGNCDNICCNTCWELISAWTKAPEKHDKLQQAVLFLRAVQNDRLRHGLAHMIWQMFIEKRLEKATLLTEKVGKSPIDRRLRQVTGMAGITLKKFLVFTINLLDVFLESSPEETDIKADNKNTVLSPSQPSNHELIWHDFITSRSSNRISCLISLVASQPLTDPNRVIHHKTLCQALRAIINFNMKSIKILSLFDQKENHAFFKPLDITNALSQVTDESVIEARKKFLDRLITLSVGQLGDAMTNEDQEIDQVVQETGYSDWSYLATELGQLFGIEANFVASKQCVELYSSGFDTLALQTLEQISDKHNLGVQLMNVAGARLKRLVFCKEVHLRADRISLCSTGLSNWLLQIDESVATNTTTNWLQLQELLMTVVGLLDKECKVEYKRAREMLEVAHRGSLG